VTQREEHHENHCAGAIYDRICAARTTRRRTPAAIIATAPLTFSVIALPAWTEHDFLHSPQ
jgi:hypothetical protein